MSEITVLKPVTDAAFKQKVLMKLLNTDAIVLLKDKFDRHLPLKVVRAEQDKFYCKGAVKMDLDFSPSGHYTAHFKVDNEKFLIEANPSMENGQVVLSLKRIFHLQQRKTVRYKVPPRTDIKLIINSHNEESCVIKTSVTDLNSLGCSVIVNKTSLRAGDLIDATLINDGNEPLQLQGIIRNIRPHGPEQFAMGVEFHHLLYCGEDKLTSMIAELHSTAHLKSS
ncbi:hypothetical protein CIK05_14280 [Bdellovibrio sp. qaytius]|nr:hypothetical protein CIK05_14280 [Bdellovibrio sp. qaytius]